MDSVRISTVHQNSVSDHSTPSINDEYPRKQTIKIDLRIEQPGATGGGAGSRTKTTFFQFTQRWIPERLSCYINKIHWAFVVCLLGLTHITFRISSSTTRSLFEYRLWVNICIRPSNGPSHRVGRFVLVSPISPTPHLIIIAQFTADFKDCTPMTFSAVGYAACHENMRVRSDLLYLIYFTKFLTTNISCYLQHETAEMWKVTPPPRTVEPQEMVEIASRQFLAKGPDV